MNEICDALRELLTTLVWVKNSSDFEGVDRLEVVMQRLVLFASVLLVTISTRIFVITGSSLRKTMHAQGRRLLKMQPTIALACFTIMVACFAGHVEALGYDEECALTSDLAVRYCPCDLMPLYLYNTNETSPLLHMNSHVTIDQRPRRNCMRSRD